MSNTQYFMNQLYGFDPTGSIFGPSQQKNPYSQFAGQPLPPTSYVGWPTDAQGNPIKAPPGMTLNSTPAQAAPQAPPQAPPPANSPITNQLASNAAMQRILQNNAQGLSGSFGGTPGSGNQAPSVYGDPIGLAIRANAPPPGYGPYGYSANQAAMGITPQIAAARAAAFGAPGATAQSIAAQEGPGGALAAQTPGQQVQAAPAAAPAGGAGGPVNSSGLTAQQYLSLLANPGHVTTPGATGPQAPTNFQPSNNVLAQFLANWKPAQSGAGSGFQQAFAKALGQ
jgi:hypothetical protein